MAVPYHSVQDNSEALSDFQLEPDFEYLDSQYLQSIINVQQAAPPIYGLSNSISFELHEPLHVPHSNQLQILHLPEIPHQHPNEEGDDQDFNGWFFDGSGGHSNPKISLPHLETNAYPTMGAGWGTVHGKDVRETQLEQQTLDMSWEDISIISEEKHLGAPGGRSISSTTTAGTTDFSCYQNSEQTQISKPLQEVRSQSTNALTYFGHPQASPMSTCTTDGESEKRQHRRSMSCHSVDSAAHLNSKFPSADHRTRRQNHFQLDEVAKSKNNASGNDLLMDLESKLFASMKTKAASPGQVLRGGEADHPAVSSWEDSRTSEPTMFNPSARSSSRRRDRNSLDSISVGLAAASPPRAPGSSQLQVHGHGQQNFNQEQPGIRLVNLLVGCADSVANKNSVLANALLGELSIMVNPYGDTMQRIASYFTYGLAAHMAGTGSGQNLYRALGLKEPSATDTLEAFRVFCEVCPFIKFGEAATTQAVLEAFTGEQDVHLIDLGMVQGSQWLRLLQGLATRPGGAPKMIQLTGIQVKPNPRSTESLSSDDQHGQQLKEFAEKLQLNFSYHLISVEKLEQIQAWMITTQKGQAIAVNCSAKMHTILYNDDMCINHVLSIIHSLRPKLFSLLEQEANHNVPLFLPRFLEALHFYSAMFDSLDATLTKVSTERAKVEQLWLGQEIINILACEGRDRVERHEKLQQWRIRLVKAGFRSTPLSDKAILRVKAFPSIVYGTGFTLVEDRGSLILIWQDRPLFSCSIWTC